jgi:hypothetical protein
MTSFFPTDEINTCFQVISQVYVLRNRCKNSTEGDSYFSNEKLFSCIMLINNRKCAIVLGFMPVFYVVELEIG